MGCDIFPHLLKVTAHGCRGGDSGEVLSADLVFHSPSSHFLSLFVLRFSSSPTPDNFPQMAHQKRFIERKYRQELKEMRREREQQEKESDEEEDGRK